MSVFLSKAVRTEKTRQSKRPGISLLSSHSTREPPFVPPTVGNRSLLGHVVPNQCKVFPPILQRGLTNDSVYSVNISRVVKSPFVATKQKQKKKRHSGNNLEEASLQSQANHINYPHILFIVSCEILERFLSFLPLVGPNKVAEPACSWVTSR